MTIRNFLLVRFLCIGAVLGGGAVLRAQTPQPAAAPAPVAAATPSPKAPPASIDFSPTGINYARGRGFFWGVLNRSAIPVAPLRLGNSPRLAGLLRNGTLYLSLREAIALGLENNLDIAIYRDNLPLADADILRARSGSPLRGVATGLVSGTPGGGGTTTGGAGATGSSAGGTTAGAGGAGAGSSGIVTTTQGAGPAIGPLDPIFTASDSYENSITPATSAFSGAASPQTKANVANFGFEKYFLTGTTLNVTYDNNSQSTNSFFNPFSPLLTSTLQVQFTQNLMQGFGRAINGRNIVIAQNNRRISTLGFEAQVMATVSQIEDIYWNTVSAQEALKVAQGAVHLDKILVSNNQRQVQIGTMAPISVTQEQAQLAADEQALITDQTNLQYQELLLKNAVTKNMANPALAVAPVVTTTAIVLPARETIPPIAQLLRQALLFRPELGEMAIQLANDRLNLRATHNELLPSLDLVGSYGQTAAAGSVNPLSDNSPFAKNSPPNPALVGGYGTTLSELAHNTYPNYAIGLSLQIPIFNRSAEADVVSSQLELQQAEMQQQQQTNQITIEVRQAQFALMQARAQVRAAQEQVRYAQETLSADQKKLQLGAATMTDVVTDQVSRTRAENNLVSALTNYAEAKVNLERLTGQTLTANHITLQEAESGQVTQMPQPQQ